MIEASDKHRNGGGDVHHVNVVDANTQALVLHAAEVQYHVLVR